MKTMIAFLTGFAFLIGCQSSVNQEKPPEWPPMTRTETAKSPFKSSADQYLAMQYFQDRPAAVPKKGPLPGNEIDRARALYQAEKERKKQENKKDR